MDPSGIRNPWTRSKFPRGFRALLVVSLLCILSLSLTLISKDSHRSHHQGKETLSVIPTNSNQSETIIGIPRALGKPSLP